MSALIVVALNSRSAWLSPHFAYAQDRAASQKSVLDELVQMNKKALADYDAREWIAARRLLLEALLIAKKAGLEDHPVMARMYVHLGAVYVTGFKDRQRGLQAFAHALDIEPHIALTRNMATVELDEVFASAAERAKPRANGDLAAPRATYPGPERPVAPERRSAGRAGSKETNLPANINALDCPTTDDVPPRTSIEVRCALAENLPVTHIVLMYREPGHAEYVAVEMEKTARGWYRTEIPEAVVTGTSIQFYVEGRSDAGKPMVTNGRPESPNLILIHRDGPAETTEHKITGTRILAEGTEENPLEERPQSQRPRPRFDNRQEASTVVDVTSTGRIWWIGLGLGSGYGYARGNGLETRTDLRPYFRSGTAWAGLGHLAPEIGYQFTPELAMSIEGRNQWIPETSRHSNSTAQGAQSVLARLLVFTRPQKVRFFGSVIGGGGQGFRFVVYPDPRQRDVMDTIRGGPLLAGAGCGWRYDLSRSLSLVVELNLLAGFPAFSIVADLNGAIQFDMY